MPLKSCSVFSASLTQALLPSVASRSASLLQILRALAIPILRRTTACHTTLTQLIRCEFLALLQVRPVAFALVLGPNNSALSWRRAKNEGAHVVQDPLHHLLRLSPVVLQYRYHSLESLLRVTYFLRTLRSRSCRYSRKSRRVAQLLRGNVPEHPRSICLSNGWPRRQDARFRVRSKSYRPSA